MSTLQIRINKIIADYSSSCHFKIKIVVSTSPNKETVENKHSFKYEKGVKEVNVNDQLELSLTSPLTTETKLQFFLQVYTKTGYKTAGMGLLSLSSNVSNNIPIKIEIQKCPLGQGFLEITFLNLNLGNNYNNNIIPGDSNQPILTNNKINNSGYNNTNYNNAYNQNNYTNSGINNIYPKPTTSVNYINQQQNNDLLNEKDRQISELKTKIDYYEQENNELKSLVNDFKKEKRTLVDEKNNILSQQKEQMQKILNEKEDLQIKYMTLQQKVNTLQSNKNDTEMKANNMKVQNEKQMNDLLIQIKNLQNLKLQLENENKAKEEKIITMDKRNKEMVITYQKRIEEINSNFSNEKNDVNMNYNVQLKSKEEEIVRLNIKINSLEDNIQSLNDMVNSNQKNNEKEKFAITENTKKLLDQISAKDKKIFEMQKQINELNTKIESEMNNKNAQNEVNLQSEQELRNNINKLQEIINNKDNEINDLRAQYDNLKYENSKIQAMKINYKGGDDDEFNDGNNEIFINQLKDMQKTYKDRETKLLNEKNEEIRKLKIRNKDLIRGSVLESGNNNVDLSKYISEINRLKNVNSSLEEDLSYYKELNAKLVDSEKKSTQFETENVKLQNSLNEKKDELNKLTKQHKELTDKINDLEIELVSSKGKLGDVLNELAEAESKCVVLEEEKAQLRKMANNMNGGSSGKH